jgi:hypothetical protein
LEGTVPEKPLVFISHRHADREIATTVAQFLRERTAGAVTIFLSSNPKYEGPKVGKILNEELKRALGQCDLVLLVFTSDSEDWSYCMWECGVATDPSGSKSTDVVVIQCGDTAPSAYSDVLRVKGGDPDSIIRFLTPFLTTTDYFPDRGEPLTGFKPESPELRQFAEELAKKLSDLPPSQPPEESPRSPFVRFEIDATSRADLRDALGTKDRSVITELIRTRTRVVKNHLIESIFGFRLDASATLDSIVAMWENETSAPALWLDSLVDQIASTMTGEYSVVRWAPYRVEQGKAIIPFVACTASAPTAGPLSIDTYFIPMSPRPTLVTERMIGVQSMFHKNLAETPAEDINLAALRTEMKLHGHSRLPLLGDGGRPLYIVHGSVIAEFMTDLASSGTDVRTLTLNHLIGDNQWSELFAGSFAVVGPTADLEAAIQALSETDRAQDVFVTSDGTRTGKVLGWLTNTMFVEAASP